MTVAAAAWEHVDWFSRATGYEPGPGFRAISCVSAQGLLRGVVGFDGWTPSAVSMHVALCQPLAPRALLRAGFSYAFGETGRRLARGEVRGGNLRSLALALHLGFRQVYEVVDGWAPGESLVLLELRREECRWMTTSPVGRRVVGCRTEVSS